MKRPSAPGTLVISIAHLTQGRTMDSRTAVQVGECLPSMPPAQDRPLANEQGRRVALATRALLALGHRRILLVSGPDSDASVADACLSGHCQVMLAEQLPLLPRLQLDTAAEFHGPELLSLLESVAPTALLCTKLSLAARLQTLLQAHPELALLLVIGPDAGEAAELPSVWH